MHAATAIDAGDQQQRLTPTGLRPLTFALLFRRLLSRSVLLFRLELRQVLHHVDQVLYRHVALQARRHQRD